MTFTRTTYRPCITPKCGKPAYNRGQCEACHKARYRALRRGNVTDAELEAAGLLLPCTGPGRPSPFHRAIEAFRNKTVPAAVVNAAPTRRLRSSPTNRPPTNYRAACESHSNAATNSQPQP